MKNAREKIEKIIESPDLSVITEKHANKWVALSSDYKKLLAAGDTLSSVLEKAKSYRKKVVIKVLPDLGYAPLSGC